MSKLENLLIKVRNSEALKALPIWKYVGNAYDLFLKVITLNSGLSREIYPGLVFNCSYSSKHAIPANIATDNSDLPSLDYIRTNLEKNDNSCFLDCGANHGLFTLVANRWVGQNGSVIAFEPHTPTLKVMQENLARNHCHHVTCVNAAVGDAAGIMKLFCGRELGRAFSLLGQDLNSDSMEVDIITLDDYCQQHQIQPSCIKIDVEGFEFQVLKGTTETLKKFRDTIKIICEMHTFMWDKADFDLEILELAHSCGLQVFDLNGLVVNRIQDYGQYVIAKEF